MTQGVTAKSPAAEQAPSSEASPLVRQRWAPLTSHGSVPGAGQHSDSYPLVKSAPRLDGRGGRKQRWQQRLSSPLCFSLLCHPLPLLTSYSHCPRSKLPSSHSYQIFPPTPFPCHAKFHCFLQPHTQPPLPDPCRPSHSGPVAQGPAELAACSPRPAAPNSL